MSPVLFTPDSITNVTNDLPEGATAFERVGSVAGRQHGVISRPQLRMLELSDHWVDRQLAAGYLHRWTENVYGVGHLGISRRGRATAALLRAGDGSALSHETAARMWGIMGASNDGPIHVSLQRRRGLPDLEGVTVHRPRTLASEDIEVHRGLPITSPERTVRDLLRTSTVVEITRILEQMVTVIGRSPDDLHAWAAKLAPVRGRDRLFAALEHVVGPAVLRSELESAFRTLCQSAGLPLPETNVRVRGWEVDVLWRELGVIVELDSWRYHGGRWSFYRDRDKGLALNRAGFQLIRVTWPQVKHRESDVVQTLVAVLGRAAAAR